MSAPTRHAGVRMHPWRRRPANCQLGAPGRCLLNAGYYRFRCCAVGWWPWDKQEICAWQGDLAGGLAEGEREELAANKPAPAAAAA